MIVVVYVAFLETRLTFLEKKRRVVDFKQSYTEKGVVDKCTSKLGNKGGKGLKLTKM